MQFGQRQRIWYAMNYTHSHLAAWFLFDVAGQCSIRGQVFQYCGSCPATCSNPIPSCPAAVCKPGCGCPSGTLLDTVNNKCVTRDECPPNCAVSFHHLAT